MLRDYGRLSVRDVLEPAIYYAEHGHPVLPRVADTSQDWRPSSRRNGRRPMKSGCRGANRRRRIRTSGTRRWRKRGSGSLPKPKASAAAKRRSKRRAKPFTVVRRRGDPGLSRQGRGDGRQRRPAQGRSDRQRYGDLVGERRSACDLRLPWLDRRQDRTMGAGARLSANALDPEGHRPGFDGSRRRGICPHRDGGHETRLCRSRGLLRRPEFLRRAARRICCPIPMRQSAEASSAPRLRWTFALAGFPASNRS